MCNWGRSTGCRSNPTPPQPTPTPTLHPSHPKLLTYYSLALLFSSKSTVSLFLPFSSSLPFPLPVFLSIL